uniref:SNTX thioredoxin-like domain-containing protein n=1 Tax=Astyanax mexicanus TaxID=7994 RepID=A0A8B9JNQ3_ASTMX
MARESKYKLSNLPTRPTLLNDCIFTFADSTITIAALGRPLHLGRLYDCRNDSFITGVTLWDEEELNKDLRPMEKPNTEVHYSNSDSIQKKARLLNVSASLKASFLGGLVEVGGSAKYLNDQKSSTNQSRITMQYIQTTRREELTMKHLSKITYPQVFEDKNATHVVTGVDYGAQAFMVFDKMTSEEEDVKSVDGAVEAMVRKMFPVDGKASVNLSTEEKSLAENINCTFYGDFELEENPTTFAEAVQLYKKLPSFLKQDKSKAVPLKVTLYPLASLDSRAAKLERSVQESLLNKVESALDELTTVDMRCQDLLKNKTVNDFPDVKERLQTFLELYSDYKSLFKKELRRLLPAIRSGEENEQELVNILKIHQASPFRPKILKQWLESFQIEVDRLHDYIGELSSITSTVTSSERFTSILSKSTVDTVICFSFTSLKDEDPILASLPTIFDDFEKLPSQPKTPTDQIDGLRWFNNPEIIRSMNKNVLLFKNFCEANQNKPNTMFVIATIPDPSNPGTSIRRYEKCEMVDGSFQPVSKPPLPTVEILDKSVVLKLQKPPTGVPVKFRV